MNSIHNLIGYFPAVHNGRVLALLSKKRNITLSGGGNHNAKAFTFSDVVRKEQAIATTLWVVNETVEQEHMARALRLWTDQEVTTYNILPFDSQRARFSEADNHRNAIEFVYRLCEGKRRVIVAPYADLVSTFPDIEEIREKTVSFNRGASLRVTDLFEKLIELGYEVSDAAELDKGTYSRRGEIITIFPLGFDYPVRMNTAFDSIESIGLYDPENDEIFEELDDISLIPAKVLKVSKTLSDLFAHSTLVVEDELDVIDEFYEAWNTIM